MGQDDVLKVLEKNKNWMITGEIMSVLNISRVNINRALRMLYKDGVVLRKDIPTRRGGKTCYLWKYKD